jgi:uncharacterized protein
MKPISDPLTIEQKNILLSLARKSIELTVNDLPPIRIISREYSPPLNQNGASFVTLSKHGNLRGCIGTLEPYQSLVEDVYEHATAAAINDYRFLPVEKEELDSIHIEISRLTLPSPLNYKQPTELPALLRPGIDGVILRDGFRRATFLPQVWSQIPGAPDFLTHLCQKMGASGSLWRQKLLQVEIYEVEEFEEAQ